MTKRVNNGDKFVQLTLLGDRPVTKRVNKGEEVLI